MRFVAAAALAAAWDYLAGGSDWVDGVCTNPDLAAKQSPIQLPDAAEKDGLTKFVFTYPVFEEPVKLYATGHSLGVTFPDWYKGGYALVEDVMKISEASDLFRLKMMELHSPGEHLLAGGVRPRLEVQFMHQNGYGVGGVAIPFVDGDLEHPFLTALLEKPPPQANGLESMVNLVARGLDIGALVDGAAFNLYDGSLTVPPCDPNVKWVVRAHPIVASAKQLYAIETAMKQLSPPRGNARDVKEVGSRHVSAIAAVNWNSENVMEEVTSALNALPAVPDSQPLVDAEDVLGSAFQALGSQDSPALASAKAELVKAQQDLEGASVGVGQAKGAYDNTKALYDGSAGLVGKIQTMWSVIATKQGYDGALALQASCYSKYYAALGATIAVVETELNAMLAAGVDETSQKGLNGILTKLQAEKAMAEKAAAESAENAESLGVDTATDRVLEKPTVLPDKYLKYEPEVVPHQHESANPFDPAVAERTERIGARPGQQTSAHNRMHASIRQAQGVGQATHPASLRDVKHEPEPPSEEQKELAAKAQEITASAVDQANAAQANAVNSITSAGTASAFLHPKDAKKAREEAAPARRVKAWWES
jgi:carbonic anhydrase